MKKRVFILAIFMVLLMTGTSKVKAANSYLYDSNSNTYTLNTTSGDITENLKAVLDEIQTSAVNRGTIVIKPGNYECGTVSIKKSYITFKADGATITYKKGADAYQYMIKGTEISSTGLVFSGGTYDGNKQATWLMNFNSNNKTNQLTLENCTLQNAATSNIRVLNGDGIKLNNVCSTGASYGIDIKQSQNVIIENSNISSCKAGIDLRIVKGSVINTSATDCSLVGLQVKDKDTSITVSNCIIERNNSGISLTIGASIKMDNSRVCNNQSNGISPVGRKGNTTQLVAYKSLFNNNGRHGIAADTYITLSITDCEASGNAINGILFNHYCKANQITNTVTNGNGGTGIFIENGSSCGKIQNCTANKNGIVGISLQDTGGTISKCVTKQNKKYGIANGGNKKATLVITECDASENGASGINVLSNKTVKILKTKANGNKMDGVQSTAAFLKITGKNNEMSNNAKNGIAGRGGKIEVSEAIANANKNAGVCFKGKTVSGYCTGSQLYNNKIGVAVQEGAVVSKLNSNKFSGNKKYGVVVYKNGSGRKTTIKQMKKNTFLTSGKGEEFMFWDGVVMPSGIKKVSDIGISADTKLNKKVVSGMTLPSSKVTVQAGKKKYTTRSNAKGYYSVKTDILASGTSVTVIVKDKYGNTYTDKKEF